MLEQIAMISKSFDDLQEQGVYLIDINRNSGGYMFRVKGVQTIADSMELETKIEKRSGNMLIRSVEIYGVKFYEVITEVQ